MARFLQSSIDEVLRRSDIVETVSSYVSLRRNGSDYVGLCPFHREKTPSFHISSDRQLFYCFGCGTGGNLIDFVMKIENLDFVDSIKFLAERTGVILEEEVYSPEIQKKHNLRERILKMNTLAAKRYVQNLAGEDAKGAIEYATKRGLTRSVLTSFGIGFAKDSWSDMLDYLNQNGFKNDEIITAGLATRNEKGRVYDKFRNRLMFPIIDVRGNVIAFSGRALGDDAAKYMNSPETPVYHKGDNIFALNIAKQYGLKDGLILVEGNMDAVSLHSHGFPNAVAGLGTALTENQASLLKRYASAVYICYDNDEAGQKAADKAIDILSNAGVKIKVVSYQGAKDPDEFLTAKGDLAFKNALASSLSATEHRILKIRKKYNLVDVQEKIEFINQAAEILAKNQNVVEREIYIKRIAHETDISAESITVQVNKLIYNQNRKEYKTKERKIQSVLPNYERASQTASDATYKAERMLLNLMFFSPQAFRIAKSMVAPDDISDTRHQKLFDEIIKYKDDNINGDCPLFISSIPEELKSLAADILCSEYVGDSVAAIKDNINNIQKQKFNRQINKLASEGKINEINDLIKKENERRANID